MNPSFAALERYGLLLLTDNALPAHAQLVAGGPIVGSWWGHAAGKAIFNGAAALEAHPDATTAKLVNGKVTFVHARLWPALVGVGRARAAWQTTRLSSDATALLAAVDRDGTIASDDPSLDLHGKARTAAFTKLRDRLLVASVDEHTAKGSHHAVLSRWDDWAVARGVIAGEDGAETLERAARALGPTAKMPWERAHRAGPG